MENQKIIRMDYSQVKEGQKVGAGNLYDAQDRLIGPAPTKEYASHEEWQEELRNYALEIKDKENKIEPTTWTEFSKKEFPKKKWRIKDLIPCEGIVIIASPSGEKKTWIAMEMARSIACGSNFLDSEEFPTIQAKILYIDQEMAQSELHRRGKQLKFDQTGDNIWLLSCDDLNLADDDKLENLKDFISREEIKVVFVDTFRAIAGGLKEDKAEEVRAFFNKFRTLKNLGITFIFLDHCRKPHPFEGKIPKKEQVFASQDKVASCEILLMLRSDRGNDEILIYPTKNRMGKELEPFRVIMEDAADLEGNVLITNMRYSGQFEEKDSKKEEAKTFILSSLESDGQKTRKEIIELVYTELKIGQRNTSEALRELASEQKINIMKKGRENSYKIREIPTETDPDSLFNA